MRDLRRLKIVLANGSLAAYLDGGGHWMCFLQHLLGLQDLGLNFSYLELLRSTGDSGLDQCWRDGFFKRMEQYGLLRNCILIQFPQGSSSHDLQNAQIFGRTRKETNRIVSDADILWNYAYALRPPLLLAFKKRAL